MNSGINNKVRAFKFFVLLIFFLSVSCSTSKHPVNTGPDNIAIKGFDTVAYFIMGEPVRGSETFAYEWNNAKWLFSSKEHLDLFAADPGKYAPQYGGY